MQKKIARKLVESVIMVGVILLGAAMVHQSHIIASSFINDLHFWYQWLTFFIGYFWFVGLIFTIASAMVFVAYYSMYVQYNKTCRYWK